MSAGLVQDHAHLDHLISAETRARTRAHTHTHKRTEEKKEIDADGQREGKSDEKKTRRLYEKDSGIKRAVVVRLHDKSSARRRDEPGRQISSGNRSALPPTTVQEKDRGGWGEERAKIKSRF